MKHFLLILSTLLFSFAAQARHFEKIEVDFAKEGILSDIVLFQGGVKIGTISCDTMFGPVLNGTSWNPFTRAENARTIQMSVSECKQTVREMLFKLNQGKGKKATLKLDLRSNVIVEIDI